MRLEQAADETVAWAGHVEGRVALSDVIELLPDNRFLLHGRHADLINIAGKRTSLAYLNHQLAAVPGVPSMAPSSCPTTRVPTASPGSPPSSSLLASAPAEITAALRQRIEAIFLPRPLVLVDELPRNSTGKLLARQRPAGPVPGHRVGHGRG